MFDIGFSELVVIALIALIVLGPQRLPEVARTAGKWIGQVRRFIGNVKQDLDREMRQEELSELRTLREELNSTRHMMENTSGELVRGFSEISPEKLSGTNHTEETPKLAQAGAPNPAPEKRARAKPTKQSRPGKPHGGTLKKRRA